MIIVTGAAGFIGSNLIKGLNQIGITDILAVDDLTDGKKYRNLAVVQYADYMDYHDFLKMITDEENVLTNLSRKDEMRGKCERVTAVDTLVNEDYERAFNIADRFSRKISAVFHQGACSDTTQWNGHYMMKNNYDYSKSVLHYCLDKKIPFIYASSAAVYGAGNNFDDRNPHQLPLNVYGYSKWKFDEYVQLYLKNAASQIVGLRYFNVYGPHENHKGKMASVAFHLMNQLQNVGTVKLFSSYGGYGDGAHERDFIFIEDVVKVILWFYKNPEKKGIFNLGTGQARCFNDIAKKLIQLNGSGKLEYIPFPDSLKGAYQCFTQANLTALRAMGFDQPFTTLENGLEKYFQWFHGDGKFHRG